MAVSGVDLAAHSEHQSKSQDTGLSSLSIPKIRFCEAQRTGSVQQTLHEKSSIKRETLRYEMINLAFLLQVKSTILKRS